MAVPQYFSQFLENYKCHDQFPNDENYEKLKATLQLTKGEVLKGVSRRKKLVVQQKYKLDEINGEDVITCRRTGKKLLKHSQFFEAMEQCHQQIGHPGRDLTHKKLQEVYVCVPRHLVSCYIKNCHHCRSRRSLLQIVQGELLTNDNTTAVPDDFYMGDMVHSFPDTPENLISCDNCRGILESHRKLSTITVEDVFTSNEIPVWDAVAYIYGIPPAEVQNFLTQSKKGVKLESETVTTVNLCETCVPLLSENYKAHKKFNEVSHSSSVFQQFVNFSKRDIKAKPVKRKIEPKRDPIPACSSSIDIDTESFDDLFDDFNFDDERQDSSLPLDDNFGDEKPELVKEPPLNAQDINYSADPQIRVTRGSVKSKQPYVKLEKMSTDDILMRDLSSHSEGENNDSDYIPEEDTPKIKKKVTRVPKPTKAKPKTSRTRIRRQKSPTESSVISHVEISQDGTIMDPLQNPKLEGADNPEATVGVAPVEEKVYSCDKCEKTFSTRNKMRHHRRTHDQNPYYHCQVCGRSYRQSSYSSFRDHMLSHSGEKRFKCTKCGESFQRRSQLDSHKRIHIEELNYSCEQCGKCFKLVGQLNAHRMIHVNEEHFCKECGKCFKSKEYMRIHFRRVHTGQKYVCEECGSTFSQRYGLTLHVKRLHKNELIFECEICGKHLSSIVRKRSHMWKHTGEKPLKCKVEGCDASYGNIDAYNAHVRSHQGIKFECDVCGKKFDRKQYLKWHTRVHTGEKRKKRNPVPKMENEADLIQNQPLFRPNEIDLRPNEIDLRSNEMDLRPNETLTLVNYSTDMGAPANVDFVGHS